jgi:hypothetical protein
MRIVSFAYSDALRGFYEGRSGFTVGHKFFPAGMCARGWHALASTQPPAKAELRPQSLLDTSIRHELAQQAVEMMHALFLGRRMPAGAIMPSRRVEATLHLAAPTLST